MSNLAHEIPPPQVDTPHLDEATCRAALQAFFRIAELWSLSPDQAITLLGRPGRSTYFKWKKGAASSLPFDTLQRISYVLGIFKALELLFQNAKQADAWIHKPNELFAGQSALDRMLAGDVVDLASVRQTLDATRGLGL